jgi:TetR/AcrR family transcriptional regulator, fatty acid metabolism regulator protein
MRTKEGDKERDIINASITVFGDEGYNGAKMHHIAEHAGVAIGTVYLYFRNKEKILLRIFEIVWTELYNIVMIIKKSNELDPMQKMERLIDLVFDYFSTNPKLSMVLINQQKYIAASYGKTPFHTPYFKALKESESIIAEGQEKGVFNPSISANFFQYFFFGGIRNSLLQWANDAETISLSELRTNIKTVLMAGIATHETEK